MLMMLLSSPACCASHCCVVCFHGLPAAVAVPLTGLLAHVSCMLWYTCVFDCCWLLYAANVPTTTTAASKILVTQNRDRRSTLEVLYAVRSECAEHNNSSSFKIFRNTKPWQEFNTTTVVQRRLCSAYSLRDMSNKVPHVAICVFEPFITAAAALVQDTAYLSSARSSTNHRSSHTIRPQRGYIFRHCEDVITPAMNAWNILDEVGGGACPLSSIARRVLGNPELHPQVRN